MSVSINHVAILFKHLINTGLYNAVFKLFDEASKEVGGKIVFLKDQWKPLYLALKYLYQPEELEKQPLELKAAALIYVKYWATGEIPVGK